jgi:hypothetical protein
MSVPDELGDDAGRGVARGGVGQSNTLGDDAGRGVAEGESGNRTQLRTWWR